MKRRILCACLSVLVLAAGLWLIPMTAGALSLSTEWSADRPFQGDEITVTVSLSEAVEVKSGLITLGYDTAILELIGGNWLVQAPIAHLDVQAARGVFICSDVTSLDGAVLTAVFRVKTDAPDGETTLTFTPELRDVEDGEIACEPVEDTLKIGRNLGSLKMNPITTAYQYVGGGEDSSSLSGLSQDGSAIYLYNNVLRTAFRVPASYKTDSEDFSTIVLDGMSFPIIERGIILGTEGQELTIDSPLKVKTTGPFREKYWTYDEETKTVTYTALVKNVTMKMLNTAYIARSYVKIEVDGEEHVVYSDTSASFTPQKLYDATVAVLAAQGKPAPRWFTNPSIDDGVVELD
ncbi:MAG: hypothetical protein E7541_02415 [Ruminococcaceae bacterium]|nr:hypothetical protein [Oscillospiraceae bacterium]